MHGGALHAGGASRHLVSHVSESPYEPVLLFPFSQVEFPFMVLLLFIFQVQAGEDAVHPRGARGA